QTEEHVRRRQIEQVHSLQEVARERPAPDARPDDHQHEERLPVREQPPEEPKYRGHVSTARRSAASSSALRRVRRNSWSRPLISASIATATTIAAPSKKIFQNSE